MIPTFRTFGDTRVKPRRPHAACASVFFLFLHHCENVARVSGKPRETRGVFSSGPPGEEDLIFIKNREAYAPSSRDCASSVCFQRGGPHAHRSEKDSSSCFAPPRHLRFEALQIWWSQRRECRDFCFVSATAATPALLAGRPVGCGVSRFLCISTKEAY